MRKLFFSVLVCLILISSICYAYTGQVQTNISITLTNTAIKIYNQQLGEQITTINISNITEFNLNYSWMVNHEYDFSGQNVTIINYTTIQNCSYSADDLEEIKVLIREQTKNLSYNTDEKTYYQLYYGCFSNLTICQDYKNANEGYRTSYDNCNAVKSTYYDLNLKLANDYTLLNSTYNTCVLDKDNYAGQRWIWAGIVTIGLLIFYYIRTKVYPDLKKSGKMGTRKERFPNLNYAPKIEEVQETINPNQAEHQTVKPTYSPPNIMDIQEKSGVLHG